jgi:hypothetical protein
MVRLLIFENLSLSTSFFQDIENKPETLVVTETLLTQTSGKNSRKELKTERSTKSLQSETLLNGSFGLIFLKIKQTL